MYASAPQTGFTRVSPREQPRRAFSYGQALWSAAAPILGSRFLFPTMFDDAVDRLLSDPTDAEVNPHHARWFFGPSLLFDIDPAKLEYRISDFVEDRRGARWVGSSFLEGGDWTSALTRLDRSPIHREMRDLIVATDFRTTRSYRALLRVARRGRPVQRNGITLAGEREIDAYFEYCVDLIASIRANGAVRRGAVALLDRDLRRHHKARPAAIDSAERDVCVAITQDGTLIRHLGGKHRTAIAQALGLPTLPVELRLVHVGWLAGEARRTGLPAHQALWHALSELA